MAASSSIFGFRNAGTRLERTGAPFFLSVPSVPFVIFVAARMDLRLRRTAPSRFWPSRFARCFLFTRRDIFRLAACFSFIAFLRSVDIDQRENGPVDFVVGRAIWPDPQRILAAAFICHFALARAQSLDHFAQNVFQIGYVNVYLQLSLWY